MNRGRADLGEIFGQHLLPNLRERKFAQPQPGAARLRPSPTTPDHKEVTMKTQICIASLLLLTVLCLMLAVAPAMAGTLYSNGPYNGNTAAWGIGGNHVVTDSTNLNSSRSNVYGIDFVYWDASESDLLTTVDMSFGSTPFGTDIFSGTLTGATNTFLGTNEFGYNLYQAEVTVVIQTTGSASAYVTLSNACTTSGCDTNPISWDENSGPSTAYDNTLGSIPSESFTLLGTSDSTPEPSSLVLFGSGVLGLAGVLRRRLMG
jgi:PEP-CTERM motif